MQNFFDLAAYAGAGYLIGDLLRAFMARPRKLEPGLERHDAGDLFSAGTDFLLGSKKYIVIRKEGRNALVVKIIADRVIPDSDGGL